MVVTNFTVTCWQHFRFNLLTGHKMLEFLLHKCLCIGRLLVIFYWYLGCDYESTPWHLGQTHKCLLFPIKYRRMWMLIIAVTILCMPWKPDYQLSSPWTRAINPYHDPDGWSCKALQLLTSNHPFCTMLSMDCEPETINALATDVPDNHLSPAPGGLDLHSHSGCYWLILSALLTSDYHPFWMKSPIQISDPAYKIMICVISRSVIPWRHYIHYLPSVWSPDNSCFSRCHFVSTQPPGYILYVKWMNESVNQSLYD